jgi:hypothetical protein
MDKAPLNVENKPVEGGGKKCHNCDDTNRWPQENMLQLYQFIVQMAVNYVH